MMTDLTKEIQNQVQIKVKQKFLLKLKPNAALGKLNPNGGNLLGKDLNEEKLNTSTHDLRSSAAIDKLIESSRSKGSGQGNGEDDVSNKIAHTMKNYLFQSMSRIHELSGNYGPTTQIGNSIPNTLQYADIEKRIENRKNRIHDYREQLLADAAKRDPERARLQERTMPEMMQEEFG